MAATLPRPECRRHGPFDDNIQYTIILTNITEQLLVLETLNFSNQGIQ